jgi:hypothetical protein
MDKILDSIIEWCFNRNRKRLPSDKEIADVIDQRLRYDRGSAHGHIIRITDVNGYDYYITRSETKRYRRR